MLRPFRNWVNRKLGQIRKAKFFPLYHTGATPPAPAELIQNKALKARIRQALTRSPKAIWFPLYHTGATPPVPPGITPLIGLKARIRRVFTRSPKAIFFPLFHTGAEPLTVRMACTDFLSRKRETRIRSAPHIVMFMPAFAHVGAPVAGPVTSSWVGVSLASHFRRGGD